MNINAADGSQGADVAMTSLELRLVRSHGNPADAVLSVPTEGAGLGSAFALDVEAPDDEHRRQADLCRIGLQGRIWHLSNEGHSLACALNGERVPAGAVLPVSDGDVLELGLLRFIVEVAVAAEADVAAFDLRDLAPTSNRAEDPFGALDIDGARPQTVADPLAVLLGELPLVNVRTVKEQATISPTVQVTGTGSSDALFNDLHDGFVRAVRDPARLGDSTMWESGHALLDESTTNTFEDLTRHAVAAYPLVRDLLHGREKLDQTLDGFASLGSVSLEAEKPDEVLRLFAPELAHGAKTAIPSLTRREHHALSPDSPMPVERVQRVDTGAE